MLNIPSSHFPRLANLSLACDKGRSSAVLSGIQLMIRGGTARLCATEGKMLVCAVFPADGAPDANVILRADDFTAAVKRAKKDRARSLTIRYDQTGVGVLVAEWRSGKALLGTIPGTYPAIGSALASYTNGAPGVPCDSYPPAHLSLAQKIMAKRDAMLFTSHREAGHYKTRPALWCDGTWLALIMPIMRPEAIDPIDVAPFNLEAMPANEKAVI